MKFIRELLRTADILTLPVFALSAVPVWYFFGTEVALLFAIIYLIHGAGHLWILRIIGAEYKSMRCAPFLGGYLQVPLGFVSRIGEGMAALGGPIWVLPAALSAFSVYLFTGNLSVMQVAILTFGITSFDLLPVGSDLSGGTVLKSIAFSISRTTGLLFMFANIFLPSALLYLVLSQRGPVDITNFLPLLMGGFERLSEEYSGTRSLRSMVAMSWTEIRRLLSIYLFLLASFLFMPAIFGISMATNSAQMNTACSAGICLIYVSAVRSNLSFFLRIKRKLF